MITLMMTGARRPITSLFAAALLGGVPTPVLAQAQETAQPATVEDAAPLPRPTGRLQIVAIPTPLPLPGRSEEHTSELQSLMRISYAVFCLKKKNTTDTNVVHRQ